LYDKSIEIDRCLRSCLSGEPGHPRATAVGGADPRADETKERRWALVHRRELIVLAPVVHTLTPIGIECGVTSRQWLSCCRGPCSSTTAGRSSSRRTRALHWSAAPPRCAFGGQLNEFAGTNRLRKPVYRVADEDERQ
jgi:hypothetical protein